MTGGTLQVVEDVLGSNKVFFPEIMHVETNLLTAYAMSGSVNVKY